MQVSLWSERKQKVVAKPDGTTKHMYGHCGTPHWSDHGHLTLVCCVRLGRHAARAWTFWTTTWYAKGRRHPLSSKAVRLMCSHRDRAPGRAVQVNLVSSVLTAVLGAAAAPFLFP